MNKKFVLAAATAMYVGLSGIALADEIGLGGATGSISFTSVGNGTLTFSTSGFTVSAPLATFQSPKGTVLSSGTATLGAMSGTTGTDVGGIFTLSPSVSESFSYTATSPAGTDALTGTITWVGIKDGTSTPSFDVNSFLTVATVAATSSAAFKADFPVNGTSEIDFTLNANPTLAALALASAGTTEALSFSSGEVVPTPLPATLPLLATGLVGLWGLGRKRKARGRLDSALAT
jgi:hypothetical protein